MKDEWKRRRKSFGRGKDGGKGKGGGEERGKEIA